MALNIARRLWLNGSQREHVEDQPKRASDRKAQFSDIFRALNYARPYRGLAVLSMVIMLFSVGAHLLAPWPLKFLIDNVLERHELPPFISALLGSLADNQFYLLIIVVLFGFAVTLAINGLGVLDKYVNTALEQRMILDFRGDLFQHVERLSFAFHDRKRTGKMMNRINLQSRSVGNIVTTIPRVLQNVLILLGMVWIIFRIDPKLAFLAMTVVPILYYSFNYYARNIETPLRGVKNMEAETMSIIHEAVAMLRVIAAFGREDHEFQRFRAQGEEAVDARVRVTLRQTLFSLAVNGNTAAGTALVLGFGAYAVMRGDLTVGELLVVVSYVQAVYKPLESISSTATSVHEKLIALRMSYELLETEPEIVDAPDAREVEHVRGDIAFEEVSFSYRKRKNTLRDVSFEVRAGEVVGIVGPTGAGKSTLVSLLPRFADPRKGRILIDGMDIREMTLRSLREQISVVLQEPLLFSGTIADNIRYGRLEATMDEVMEAARDANAHDFIMDLPDKYETTIGERGATLSGGERQRVSVARAFLKDAPILILDEPTSSVDTRTESVILDALRRLMVGRTTLMIAHRLSTIRNADLILVIENGRIAEQGSHEDLLEADGLYAQMYETQVRHRERKSSKQLASVSAEKIKSNGAGARRDEIETVPAVFRDLMDTSNRTWLFRRPTTQSGSRNGATHEIGGR